MRPSRSYRSGVAYAAIAICAAVPLFMLVWWAYDPAQAYRYPTVSELLLAPYKTAAILADQAGLVRRQLCAVGFAVLALVLFLWTNGRGGNRAILCGVLASCLLTPPPLVDWILGGESITSALGGVSVAALGAWLLLLLARRFPAIALPLALLCFLAGVGAAIRTAGDIVIRSEPMLYVLNNAARSPNDPAAQLALGMHLMSIGGDCEAAPYLRQAGQQLSERFSKEDQLDLYNVAVFLADFKAAPDNTELPCARPITVRNP